MLTRMYVVPPPGLSSKETWIPEKPSLKAIRPIWAERAAQLVDALVAKRRFDAVTELNHERSQQGQRQSDDIVVIAHDAVDEPAAEPVDGERTGDLQRFTGGDVCHDLGIRRAPEPNLGAGQAGRGPERAGSDGRLW